MARHLIVNADDYGLCEEISSGIITAFTKGIVTSTTISAVGKYYDAGLDMLKASGIATGAHLTFVGSETPLISSIDGLVDAEGCFYDSYKQVAPRILTGRYDAGGLRKELFAQVEKILDSGINISHLDSHQHLHLFPGIGKVLIEIAHRYRIKWIRATQSRRLNFSGITLNLLCRRFKQRLDDEKFRYTDYFEGFETSGFSSEEILLKILKRCRDGLTELIMHPGYDASDKYDWGYDWEKELNAATSAVVRKYIKNNNIILTDYNNIK